MKLQQNLYAAVLSALLPLMLFSCIKEEAAQGKATVTMTFTTRATTQGAPVTGDGLEERERMQSLRVIVVRTATQEIVYNLSYSTFDKDDSQNRRLYKTITFGELTVNAAGENFDFYAIANEGGIGSNRDWDNITVNDLTTISLDVDDLTAMNNGTAKIPQTGHKTITVKPTDDGGIQQENIELEFVVAKVKLTVKNPSLAEQNVTGITVTGVNKTSTGLFASDNLSGTTTGSLTLGNIDVPAATTETGDGEDSTYGYIYENSGGDYVLTADWGKTENDIIERTIDLTNEGITEIPRGRMLNIIVTLSVDATVDEFHAGIFAWDEANMDVEFN